MSSARRRAGTGKIMTSNIGKDLIEEAFEKIAKRLDLPLIEELGDDGQWHIIGVGDERDLQKHVEFYRMMGHPVRKMRLRWPAV